MPSPESVQIRSNLLAFKAAQGQGAPVPLSEQRASFDVLVENYVGHPIPLPEGTRVGSMDVDGIPAAWIYPPDAETERVVLYLHGGFYILGSPKSHRDLVARLSSAAGVRSLLIDYRLAPEHVFPAALDDALTAYRWLLARGTKPEHIVLAGDSAGGGLTLALLQTVRDQHLPMPAGAVLLSPWTDLVGTVESRTTREAADPINSGRVVNALSSFYAGTEDAHQPLISPINADLHGFPPLHIDVGSDTASSYSLPSCPKDSNHLSRWGGLSASKRSCHSDGGGQRGDLHRDRRQLAGGVADRHAHHVACRVRGRGRLRGDRRGSPARRGIGGRRDRLRRQRPRRRADRRRRHRRPGRADPAGPRRRGHQLSASRLRRSGPRAGPGSVGPVARRDRWSRKQRTTNTLKLPFAAIPRPLPERKELLCPMQL